MLDISKYIDGFKMKLELNSEEKEINITRRSVFNAIDDISFRMLPLYQLPYIPYTISPCISSYDIKDYLEHPRMAFEEYKKMGAKKIIGELKHMGSNAVIMVFRNENCGLKYIKEATKVHIYSRRGKKFFLNEDDDRYISDKIWNIFNEINYFDRYDTDYVIMGTEILPWNLKATGLIDKEYLPALDASSYLYDKILESTEMNNIDKRELFEKRRENIDLYKQQLESYCWNSDITDLKIAPFILLGHQGKTFFDKTNKWHLEHFKELFEYNNLFVETPYVEIDLYDEDSMQKGVDFWLEVTEKGYEGLMFKSDKVIDFNENNELIIPMLKVRGKEYLRIIYGINYEENMRYLKNRKVGKKRFLHISQFLLSVKALEAFTKGEDFENWHDYVFTSICLNNEQTDHRL